jgi:hypothetical protein
MNPAMVAYAASATAGIGGQNLMTVVRTWRRVPGVNGASLRLAPWGARKATPWPDSTR